MQIGIMLEGQAGLNWTRWRNILQLADDSGYDSVFRSDHLFSFEPPQEDALELWVSLTHAAATTEHIEFGPMVSPVTFRHPSMTAIMASQVDDLSNGRLVLGLGAGWNEQEHRKFGIPFYDFTTRYEMLEDALEMTTRMFHHDGLVSYAGKHFSLDETIIMPRPKRPGGPPLLVGGSGPKRTLPLAARYAREWNMFGSITRFKEACARLDELLAAEGRQPADLKRSISTYTIFGKDDAALQAKLAKRNKSAEELFTENGNTVGTAAQLIDQLGQWQEAGVERLLLQWLDLDDLENLEIIARDVLPHFQ